jgi:hypothetical protein
MRTSTGQPRICFTDAGTLRITEPFDKVKSVFESSTTDPANAKEPDANDEHSSNNRIAAVSPAETIKTKMFARVDASNKATADNVTDLPT